MTLPDWVRCINCKVKSVNGKIKHTSLCPDYVRTKKKKNNE